MQETLNRMRTRGHEDRGFTMIELLVVVVIIGILVAIAIPVYLNYRKGAANKTAQSDARSAITAIEQAYSENGNVYPASVAAGTAGAAMTIGGQSVSVSPNNTLQYEKVSDSAYKVCTYNSDGGSYYGYDSADGGSVKKVTATSLANCISTV